MFISYAAEDKPIADAVCAALEARHIRCWIAPRDVLPGRDYAGQLIEAIRDAGLLVLVFSSHSNSSPHVMREVERAASKGIPILPFRIEHVPPCASMEYYISSTHWLDALSPPLERHIEHLADTVRLLLDRVGREAPPPEFLPHGPEPATTAPTPASAEEATRPSVLVDETAGLWGTGRPARAASSKKRSASVRYKTWARLKPLGSGPPSRCGHSMACDPVSGRLIVFGGGDGLGRSLGDTWAYAPAANTWTDLSPKGMTPAARTSHAMVYDSGAARVILFGGWDEASGRHFDDTWAYDPAANTWTELAPHRKTRRMHREAPFARRDHAMVFDPGSGRAILYGGGERGSDRGRHLGLRIRH